MLFNRQKRFKIPKELRRPVGIILAEITREPQKRNKTQPYYRGVVDGVKLVRERAEDMGISLEEPYTEIYTKMAMIEVDAMHKAINEGGE